MISRTTNLFKAFFESERSSGIILILATIVSMMLANSSISESYLHLWETKLGIMNIEHWVNDGLMAVFLLLVGLELKREFMVGELSELKKATLPIFSAVGGMLVPALLYVLINLNHPTTSGFGIPMATDIAFALGALSLLGNRVPLAIKVFLTALAVIDDLGAILVIAIFYTKGLIWINLFVSLLLFVILIGLNRLKVVSLWIYLPVGIVMWWFMHNSGIHATITGVLLAIAIPTFSKNHKPAPSALLQEKLHLPVSYFILPLFALVNTAIQIEPGWDKAIFNPASLGIIVGLVVGKPIGIFLFTWISIKLKLAEKPSGTTWGQLFGVGILGGIGFTMSIFVTLLAFNSLTEAKHVINEAKFAIILSSIIAGALGFVILKQLFNSKKRVSTKK